MSFKPIDAKRDEYRKYLERNGVIEDLCKAILKLFEAPEKPKNAIEFIRMNLGDAMLERDTIEHLKGELEDSRNEVAQLKRQLEMLKLQYARGVPEVAPAVVPQIASTAEVESSQPPPPSEDVNPVEAIPPPVSVAAVPIESAADSLEQQQQQPPSQGETDAAAATKIDDGEKNDVQEEATGGDTASAAAIKEEVATNAE